MKTRASKPRRQQTRIRRLFTAALFATTVNILHSFSLLSQHPFCFICKVESVCRKNTNSSSNSRPRLPIFNQTDKQRTSPSEIRKIRARSPYLIKSWLLCGSVEFRHCLVWQIKCVCAMEKRAAGCQLLIRGMPEVVITCCVCVASLSGRCRIELVGYGMMHALVC